MRLHNEALASVPRVIVLNRCDLPDVAEVIPRMRAYAEEREFPFFAISAATGEGLSLLIDHLGSQISKERSQPITSSEQ